MQICRHQSHVADKPIATSTGTKDGVAIVLDLETRQRWLRIGTVLNTLSAGPWAPDVSEVTPASESTPQEAQSKGGPSPKCVPPKSFAEPCWSAASDARSDERMRGGGDSQVCSSLDADAMSVDGNDAEADSSDWCALNCCLVSKPLEAS